MSSETRRGAGAGHTWSALLVAAIALGGLAPVAACAGTLENREAFEEALGTLPNANAADGAGDPPDAGPAVDPDAAVDAPAGPLCPDIPTTVFAARCATAGCHDTTTKAQSLDLASPDVFARLSGKPSTLGPGSLLDPDGDPGKSVVYTKLLAPPPFGIRMPIGTPLDDATTACVAAWIRAKGI